MQTVPMLFVHDVEATSAWFQDFLGVSSGHGGPEFEMLMDGDRMVMQLHLIEDDHHDHEVRLDGPLGSGVVLVFYVDSAQKAFGRAKELSLDLQSDLHFNEVAHMHEFTVRDPNGYSLMICEATWA